MKKIKNQNTSNTQFKSLRKDVDLIKKTMVTKEDAKKFATKDDLKRYATKDDLKPLATKEALGKLTIAVLDLSKRVTHIEDTMATKSDVNIILERIDRFTKKVDVFDKKAVVHDYRLNEIEPRVENHEARLRVLEGKRASNE